jgi:hypothetical protein
MGYLYKGACFPDLSTAKAEQCAQSSNAWGNAGDQMTSECTQTTFDAADTSMAMCKRTNGGSCVSYSQPFQSFPRCAYDGSMSLQTDYFAAALGFLVIVWVAGRIKRMFWSNHDAI